MDISKYWKKLKEDLFVVRAEGLEDFRAVVGAKTSRATDLDLKTDIDTQGVEKFLTLNLAGYGHASIGEMSFPTIHHRGIGWVGAWMIEDDPLFVGQEVSTRAVDVRKIPNGINRCYDSPDFLNNHNDLFWNIFNELDAKNPETRGYKFDNIRWAMPGTSRVGVTSMMNGRVIMRHLERLQSVPFMNECVNNFFEGVKECAPYVHDSLKKGPRPIQNRWTDIKTIVKKKSDLDFVSSVEVTPPFNMEDSPAFKDLHIAPRDRRDYLDSEYRSLGMFKVRIYTSIAAARDWHRHRPVMPWNISLVVDEDGYPYVSPWYDTEGYDEAVKKDIKENFDKSKDILGTNDAMQALYSLPYGATVAIDAYASLPSMLYMFELRAASGGVNFEYAEQAKTGLRKTIEIMGDKFTSHHSLDRVFKKK